MSVKLLISYCCNNELLIVIELCFASVGLALSQFTLVTNTAYCALASQWQKDEYKMGTPWNALQGFSEVNKSRASMPVCHLLPQSLESADLVKLQKQQLKPWTQTTNEIESSFLNPFSPTPSIWDHISVDLLVLLLAQRSGMWAILQAPTTLLMNN